MRPVSGAAGRRDARSRNRASSSSISIQHLSRPDAVHPCRSRSSRGRSRLKDRFYDLQLHVHMQKVDRRQAAPGGQEGPARRRAGEGADAYGARHDRRGNGGEDLGRGRCSSAWPTARRRRRCSTSTRCSRSATSHKNAAAYLGCGAASCRDRGGDALFLDVSARSAKRSKT